jgi:hypothetical protein
MKEMMNCQGQKFGQGNCFNENNEFRKLAKRLGAEIGPNSVVADVINVQLRIVNTTTIPALKAGTQLVGDASRCHGYARAARPRLGDTW